MFGFEHHAHPFRSQVIVEPAGGLACQGLLDLQSTGEVLDNPSERGRLEQLRIDGPRTDGFLESPGRDRGGAEALVIEAHRRAFLVRADQDWRSRKNARMSSDTETSLAGPDMDTEVGKPRQDTKTARHGTVGEDRHGYYRPVMA